MSAQSMALAAALLLLIPACSKSRVDATFWEREQERIELAQRLKLAEYQIEQKGGHEAGELDRQELALNETKQRTQELQRAKNNLTGEIENLERRRAEVVKIAVQDLRTKAVGRKFETLTTKDGRTFQNVLITAIDDGGVAVRHEHGAARLRYADLSSEQHLLFGLDLGSAIAAEERQARETAAYERQLDQELATMAANQKPAPTPQKTSPSVPRAIASNTSYGSDQSRPLAQPASRLSGRSWEYYSNYRTYRPRYRYVYYPTGTSPYSPYQLLCPPNNSATRRYTR